MCTRRAPSPSNALSPFAGWIAVYVPRISRVLAPDVVLLAGLQWRFSGVADVGHCRRAHPLTFRVFWIRAWPWASLRILLAYLTKLRTAPGFQIISSQEKLSCIKLLAQSLPRQLICAPVIHGRIGGRFCTAIFGALATHLSDALRRQKLRDGY